MAQSAELMLPCLDAAGVRSIVEVGAFAGDLTRVLVDWAEPAGARVAAVDPSPQDGLVALARERPELELIRETSLAALPKLPELPDAVVIDGERLEYQKGDIFAVPAWSWHHHENTNGDDTILFSIDINRTTPMQ